MGSSAPETPVQAMGRLAAFCCSLDSQAKLEVNVLAMRNYIGVLETQTLSDALPSEFVIIQADPPTAC